MKGKDTLGPNFAQLEGQIFAALEFPEGISVQRAVAHITCIVLVSFAFMYANIESLRFVHRFLSLTIIHPSLLIDCAIGITSTTYQRGSNPTNCSRWLLRCALI